MAEEKKAEVPKEEQKKPEAKPEEKPQMETKKEELKKKESPKPEAPKVETKKEAPKKEEPKKEKPKKKVPAKFKELVEGIEKMSVLELSELVKALEDRFGVSAAAPVAVAQAGAAGGEAQGGKEEKSEFDIELTEAGDQKIAVIKVVRDITGKGLKEAKDIVDGAPKVVKEKAKKEEADEIKKKIEDAGGKAELK